MPPGEKLVLVHPEDVPMWRSHHAELIKTEISDGIGNQYSKLFVPHAFVHFRPLFAISKEHSEIAGSCQRFQCLPFQDGRLRW